MEYQTEKRVRMPEEEQLRRLDELEAEMDIELKSNPARADAWIRRLDCQLLQPGCCAEAKLRINWLLYSILDGDYDRPDVAFED